MAYGYLQRAQALQAATKLANWHVHHEMAKFQWKVAGLKQDAMSSMKTAVTTL